MAAINDSTPIAMLTVGELKNVLKKTKNGEQHTTINTEAQYVYGIRGLAQLFSCSIPTANRIKASGKIDKAITQVGRKIVINAKLALELAKEKDGGRHPK